LARTSVGGLLVALSFDAIGVDVFWACAAACIEDIDTACALRRE